MNKDTKTSILIYAINDINVDYVKQQLEKWSYHCYNSLELQLNEHLKERILGVLVIDYLHMDPTEIWSMIYELPNLKVVSCNSSGIDHLDINTLNKKNIIIKNCPSEASDSTSDIGIVLMLHMARKIKKATEAIWNPISHKNAVKEYMGTDVRGKILGIIGLGMIGQKLAFKASVAFGMRIVYSQRNKRSDSTFPYYESLNDMLPIVDFLAVSCSLNPSTKHLMDFKRLKLMKPTAYLINIARGSIVKTDDLVEALRCGLIAGAALDVTDPEPLPNAHPLMHMENVVLLPHVGTFTKETEFAMLVAALDNLKEALENV